MSVQKSFVVPEVESPDDLLGLFGTVQDYVSIDCTCDEKFAFSSLHCALVATRQILRHTGKKILSVYKRTYNDMYLPHIDFLEYLHTYIILDGALYLVSTEEIGLEMLKEA